jgi:hypothetical protein
LEGGSSRLTWLAQEVGPAGAHHDGTCNASHLPCSHAALQPNVLLHSCVYLEGSLTISWAC